MEDMIRRIQDQMQTRQAKDQKGLITSYDPNAYAIKVMLKPQNVETGWMTMGTAHVGNNFGIAVGPAIGGQVEVGFENGDISTPFFRSHVFSNDDRPPVAQSGEIVIQSKTGGIFKFVQDGTVVLTTNGHDFTINAGAGNVHINSAKLFHNAKDIGDDHKHGGITFGSQNTDVPV